MGKNYDPRVDKPFEEKKRDAQTEDKESGIYEGPKRKGPSPALMVAILLVTVLLVWLFLAALTHA